METVTSRMKRVWRDMSYSGRRIFELRTGVPATKPSERPRLRGTVEELEALFDWDEPRLRGC